jgi:hypothetical protein
VSVGGPDLSSILRTHRAVGAASPAALNPALPGLGRRGTMHDALWGILLYAGIRLAVVGMMKATHWMSEQRRWLRDRYGP